jgi:F0F1-type ATP synthase delta subunit
MTHLSESIKGAQMTMIQMLVDTNQRLSHYLDSPFLPAVEKKRIWEQIQKNIANINKLKQIHEPQKVS